MKFKRKLLVLTGLALLGSLFVVAEPASAAAAGRILADPCLNFRAGYDHNTGWDNQIGCIPINVTVQIQCVNYGLSVSGPYGTENIWDKVSYGGLTGYVSDAWVYTGTNGAAAGVCAAPTPLRQGVVSSWNTSTQTCARVLFVGIRGSGETNSMGDKVGPIYSAFVSSLSNAISSRAVYLDYSAASTNLLKWPNVLTGAKQYLASVTGGEAQLRTVLNDSRNRCHDTESVVLAGYSQGAMIANTVSREYPYQFIAAMDLVADPDRVPSNNQVNYGTASPGKGIYSWLSQVPVTALPTAIEKVTINLCNKNDVVCDSANALKNPLALSQGLTTHSAYGSPALAQVGNATASMVSWLQFR